MVTTTTGNDDGTVILILFAVTIQLIRLAIDLIQMASAQDDVKGGHGKDDKNLKAQNPSSSLNLAENASIKKNNAKNDGYGSIPSFDEPPEPISIGPEHVSRWSDMHFWFFEAVWLVFAVGYATVSILGLSTLFSHILLNCTVFFVLLEMLLQWRDYERERYGWFSRFLHLLAFFFMWSAYIHVAMFPFENLMSVFSSDTTVDLILLTVTTVAVLLAVTDGWSANRNPTPRRRYSLAESSKSTLSAASMGTLLKPYVWPDDTPDGSAFWNRARAVSTWLCVIGSKMCNLTSPLFLGWASTALAHEQYSTCIRYSISYAILNWTGSTLKEGQSLFYLKVAQAAYVQLSETAFEHLHGLSLDWHLQKKLGEVLRAMDRGIAACDTLMKYLFLWLVPAMVECLVVTVILATYFSYLPLAIAVFYYLFAYVTWTILVTLWRKKFRKALVKHDNEYHDLFADSMINFETVKFFTAEKYEKERFRDAVARYQAGSVNVQGSLSFLNISQQVLLQACMATALSLAAIGIKQRIDCCVEDFGCEAGVSECCQAVSQGLCPGMEVGDFVAVLTYVMQLFAPLNFLGSVYNAVIMATIDLSSLSELLAENPDVTDAFDAMELPKSNSVNPDIAVEFDNVLFHYPTQPDSQGLRGLSFKMKRGTTTAIVGPTGAGKTTVSRLLFRFYDVLGGAVKINGVDVRTVSQSSLRGALGVVPQNASMFNDTIRSNLRYGRRDATDEEVKQAAQDAQILKFIEELENGWDTVVGDRGLKLSGGEKQRAAIARCLLKDPPFVLLDEATSALDTITENTIQEALDRLGAERTVLVIAHRLGTIKNADNIVVLKDGKVAEQGTHSELLKLGGVYAEMWNMQLNSTSTLESTDPSPKFASPAPGVIQNSFWG